MALRLSFMVFFLSTMILSSCLEISASQIVKGKVLCSGCDHEFNFSGIKIMISCDQMKRSLTATTNKMGSFAIELPSKISSNCKAKLLGGPIQLYASKKNSVSKIVKIYKKSSDSFVLSSPLIFSTSCPASLRSQRKCGAGKSLVGSSKTIDWPMPPEWGLAPTSYYFPFLPIIGIP